jgi:hypothetical protein
MMDINNDAGENQLKKKKICIQNFINFPNQKFEVTRFSNYLRLNDFTTPPYMLISLKLKQTTFPVKLVNGTKKKKHSFSKIKYM